MMRATKSEFRSPATLPGWLFAGVLAVLCGMPAVAGQRVVDSAGRAVDIPDRVERVVAAGPPASALMTILAPDKLVGWNRAPLADDLPYLPPATRKLPEIGRLTGRGGTANLEVIMAARPDLIVDFGSTTETYVSLADRVQSQTAIPYVLVDGRFANSVAAVELLGRVLGVGERAGALTRYIQTTLAEVDRVAASVPTDQRARVYLARGARGLETGGRGSINTEIIERVGATNVVDGFAPGLANVSLEQVLVWNPDTIITVDPSVAKYIRSDASWAAVEAVRRGRVFVSPRLPYGWVDSPPSLNRLAGVQWLARLLYPGRFAGDIREVARDFYRQFYGVDLTAAELDGLLDGSLPKN